MRIFITGGAGFIGCNLAAKHLQLGDTITIYDNFSRVRTTQNLEWLQNEVPRRDNASLQLARGDVRDYTTLSEAVALAKPDLIVHLASQVAVTTSVKNPREDFEINALGTFNVLEAARSLEKPPTVFYASTNKVYGGMEEIVVEKRGIRYQYRDFPNGISEDQSLDFHSPYGCSKGAGDQYVRDYYRIYGIPTVVFRQSCIYGPRQFGVEDQGWVAHFVIAAAFNRPITIYGDGMQVRDMLHVNDLIEVYGAALENIHKVSGEIFNIGGGKKNTLAIWSEFGPLLEELASRKIEVKYGDWRPGDQPCFISDNGKAERLLGWSPRISVRDGIRHLWEWVTSNPQLFH
jgi:CDP-paratose 2-epimerase